MPRGSTSTPFGVAKKCFSPRAGVPALKVKKPKKHPSSGSANTSSKVPVILLGSDEPRFANEIEKWASRTSSQATKFSTFHAATMANWPGAKPLNELPDYTGRVTIKGPIDTSHKLLNSYDGEVTGAPEISQVTVNVLKTVGHGLEDPHFSKWTEAVRRRLRSEIGAWMEVDGPFVHYLGFAIVGGVPAVLTQSLEATSSKKHLQKLSMQEKRLMILGFAEALIALHKEELWHGNLEPQHFVVDNKGKAKLSGFCFNHMIEKELGKVTLSKEHRRSARYAAPEVLEENAEDEKSDVYSFACVALGTSLKTANPCTPREVKTDKRMAELLTGKQPFYTTQGEDSVAQRVINGEVPFSGDYPELQDDLWWSTLKMCWSRNPEDRPPMRTVYKEVGFGLWK